MEIISDQRNSSSNFSSEITTKKNALSITENAAAKIQELLDTRGKPSAGIRINIKSGGCKGLSYAIEYANEIMNFDEIIEEKGVKVLIDPKAVMYLIGSELDYVDGQFKSGFVFKNPNEKGKCGCGNSFDA